VKASIVMGLQITHLRDAQVDQLSQRVTALDTRLDVIEGLLKKLAGFPHEAPGEMDAAERTQSTSRQGPPAEEYSNGGGQYEDENVGQAQDSDGADPNDGHEGYDATADGGGNDDGQTGYPDEPADPDDY
jgi:hypothetical protein